MAANNASNAFQLQNPSKEWIIPLCHEPDDDAGTCCLGFCLPCILYGKTQHRLTRKAQGKDALDLTDYNPFNNECGAFFAIHYCTHCGWGCAFAQHLQVKNAYGIPSNMATDCIEVFYCWPCTLMQDEREVCARERLFKDRNGQGTIQHQPSREPEMEYAPTKPIKSPESESPLHRQSLMRANESIPMAAQAHGLLNNLGIHKENDSQVVNNSQHTCELSRGKDKAATDAGTCNISQRKRGVYNLTPAISANSVRKSPRPNIGDKDAIIASRQPWRGQKAAGQTASSETDIDRTHSQRHQYDLAQSQDGTVTRNENRDRTTMYSSSERSISESLRLSKGKNVQRFFSSVDSFGREVVSGTSSENKLRQRTVTETSEAVLVYYSDGERPQRHRLAECTRTRASTLGRPDAPRYEHNLSDCPSEQAASGTNISEPSTVQRMTEHAEMTGADGLRSIASQHTLNDCISKLENNQRAVQHPDMSHKLADCPGDGGSHSELVVGEAKNEDLKIFEHPLADCCQVDAVNEAAGSATVKQQNIAECVHTEPVAESANSNIIEQHSLDSCILIDEADSSDVADSEHTVVSAMTHGSESEQTLQAHTYTTTVTMTAKAAQPPVIVVTSTEVAEPVKSENASGREGQVTDILPTTTDFKTAEERGIVATDSMRDKKQPSTFEMEHDGVTERKVVPRSSQAAAALRKVLGGDGNEDDVITKPAKLILLDNQTQIGLGAGGARRHRRRGRSRAGKGRGKGPKETS